MSVPRSKVPDSVKRVKRQIRQALYRKRPEVRTRRREANRRYYARNREMLKARSRARQALGGDPERLQKLRAQFRVIAPGETIPDDAGPTTRNSFLRAGRNVSREYVLECRWPSPNGPWDYLAAAPDLSTLLGFGGKGQNRALKEFIRDEMLRRFPDRYPGREDLPTEDELLRRNAGPPDKRETEKRERAARLSARTPEFICPNCGYDGPMIPRKEGPFPARVVSERIRETLGAVMDDLLPAAYCPRCHVLLGFRPGTDLVPPRGTGTAAKFQCECGFTGRLVLDSATGEYDCPECGLVVAMTFDTAPPPTHLDE